MKDNGKCPLPATKRKLRSRIVSVETATEASTTPSDGVENQVPSSSGVNSDNQTINSFLVSPSSVSENNSAISANKSACNINNSESMECSSASAQTESTKQLGAEDQTKYQYTVVTRNRYQPLQPLIEESKITDKSHTRNLPESESEEEDEPRNTKKQRTGAAPQPRAPKSTLPPPIILHDVHKHKTLVQLLNRKTTKYSIKYARDSVVVNTVDPNDHKAIMEMMCNENVNFHTYTGKNDRQAAYVLKGLSDETDASIITKCFKKDYDIDVVRCLAMRTRYSPMWMITMPTTVTRQQLLEVAEIDRTLVTIEKYVTRKRITQCHNCQLWGHATSNCFAAPKCVKCAGDHATNTCKKGKETDAKCTNCTGNHPANATICPAFLKRKQFLDARSSRGRQSGRPAPPPTEANYPPLRTFAPAPAVNPWGPGVAATRQPPPPVRAPAAPTAGPSRTPQPPAPRGGDQNPAAAFKELAQAMSELNALICVEDLIQTIRTLCAKLRQADSQQERMLVAMEFFRASLG